MGHDLRRRFATRISLFSLTLVLVSSVLVDRLLDYGAATILDQYGLGWLVADLRVLHQRGLKVGLVLGGVGATLAYLYARHLLRPLDRLARALDNFLDNTARVPMTLTDSVELGGLALGVRKLMEQVREYGQAQEETGIRARAITRAVLDNASDGVITLNERGIVQSVNSAAERMFGHPADEVVGQNVKVLIPVPHGEQHDTYLSDYLRTGQCSVIGRKRELMGMRKDFTTFPMELVVSELQLNGTCIFTGIVRDITERKRSEGALAASEARMRAILDAAADGIITVDEWGTIESVNEAAEVMFGYKADELVGQDIQLLVPAREIDARDVARNGYSGTDIGGMVGQKRQVDGRRSDGTAFPIELAVSEVRLGDERIFTAMVSDVTERVRVQEALAQRAEELVRRNEELAQFAYVASHDLQEPLRMVASYTQLLERRYKGRLDSDADEFISYAVDGANRMQRLLRALLTYSRVGTQGQAFRQIDCEAVFRRVVANLQAAIEENNAEVTHDPLPTVMADPSQLDQIFQNLVSNAVKFQDNGNPRVHVSATREDDAWRFTVRDNGIGIDPEYFERIFVIFQRLHTKDEYPGTGMGLAICKKIVEHHGGRMWVESRLGRGAEFNFTIPDQPEMTSAETAPETPALEAAARPDNVALVAVAPPALEAELTTHQDGEHG